MRPVSESFKSRADSAAYWEAWVGAVLSRAGLVTLHHPFKYDDGKDHSKTWDLDVGHFTGKYGAPLLRSRAVEVKSLSLKFSGTEDYPYDEVLLCSQNSFLKKWPGVDYTMRDFLLVSTHTGAIVWIPTMTQVHFGKEVLDRTRNELYKAVTVIRPQLRPLQDFIESVTNDS
jgi:hypothetical protein